MDAISTELVQNSQNELANAITKENTERISSIGKFLQEIPTQLVKFAWSLLIAAVLIFVGFKVCNIIRKAIRKIMSKSNIDQAVIHFVDATTNVLLKAVIVLAAAAIIGFDKAGITAILGSVTIAISLAVQGSLSNFAGGILILVLKPFVIGDYIVESTTAKEGIVQHISIFYTTIKDDLGNIVILPNGTLANSTMTNKTNGNYFRKAAVTFQIAYSENIDNAKKSIMEALEKEDKYFLHDIEKCIFVTKLDESGIELKAVVGVKNEDYLNACYELNEIIKKALDEACISIPFPQLDVHLDR